MAIFVLFSAVLFILFSAPVNPPPRTSPVYPYSHFGGNIYFSNTSSYDLYIEFDIINVSKGGFYGSQLCLEKEDIVVRQHDFKVHDTQVINFDITSANPNNYLNKIIIYNLSTGALLTEIMPEDNIFILKSGNTENNNAVYDFIVTDSLLSGES